MDKKPSGEPFVCFNIRDFLNPEETGPIGENDLEKFSPIFQVRKIQTEHVFVCRQKRSRARKFDGKRYKIY